MTSPSDAPVTGDNQEPPVTLDIISMQDTVSLLRRFARVFLGITVLGGLLGALYWWQTGGVHYESSIWMVFDGSQGSSHLENPAAINEALIRAFSDTSIVNAFAGEFIRALDENRAASEDPGSMTRLRMLLQHTNADLSDLTSATNWLASYTQEQLVDFMQGVTQPPSSGFFLVFTVPRRERLEFSFRSYTNGIAPDVGEAASRALNILARLYNENVSSTSRARLQRQHDEMAAAYDSMSERFFKEKEEVDKSATVLAMDFARLEATLDSRLGKSNRDAAAAKTVFQIFGENQDAIFMFRSLFNVPSTSSSDVVDTFNAMRFKGFAERLVKAKNSANPEDQQFYAKALIELDRIEHGNAILMARMKPQLQALDGMRIALSSALEALVKPLDARDFALPTVKADLVASQRRLERRGRSVMRSVVIGAFIGFFGAATAILIAQSLRRQK